MRQIISSFELGDMKLLFHHKIDRRGNDCTGMLLFPKYMEEKVVPVKEYDVEPLVQMKIIGDDYPFNYSQGRTMRGSQTGLLLRYSGQTKEQQDGKITIKTLLQDNRGIKCTHIVEYYEGDDSFYVHSEVLNDTKDVIKMEMVSSFTLGGLTPFFDGLAPETMILHQIRSTWANEGRLVGRPVEEYQLEPSWKPSGANGIRFGQIGSMPNREYFPFIGIEDQASHVCWGAQLAIGSSWQLEAYRRDDALCLSGGIADREKGHWIKGLGKGEMFVTPKAILTVSRGDMDTLCQRITKTMEQHISFDVNEEAMPIVFNEFCTTWGKPEESLMKKLVDLTAKQGVDYFVIDDGWFQTEADEACKEPKHGEWVCSDTLFPGGMKSMVDYIHEKGMKAGIWYEFETCGRKSELFYNTNMLQHRDGYPITAGHRRFLNMTDSKVWDYLDDKVLNFLKNNGFDYIKIDYNANLGLGSDERESLGSSLYESVLATQNYFKHLKKGIPGLLIENCSAGGNRLVEPFLQITDMSSYSDAHESMNIPMVAANMHRMIPVRQSQIWAVLRPDFSDRMLYYKLSSTFLGRMCLSGNILNMSEHQWSIVHDGIEFYENAANIIKSGTSKIETHTGLSYKEPEGYQIVKRSWKNQVLLIIHTFEKCPSEIRIEIENQIVSVLNCFLSTEIQVVVEEQNIRFGSLRAFDGIAVLLSTLSLNKEVL